MKRRSSRCRPYLGYMHLLLIDSMVYKMNLLSSFMSSIMEFIVMIFIWTAVFHSRSSIAGFSFSEMITYLCIAQGITAIYGWSNAIEARVSERIRDGSIAFDLLKPVRFNLARIAEGIGSSFIQVIFVVLLLAVIHLFVPSFHGPSSWTHGIVFVISVCLGYTVMSFISLMAGLASFYLMSYWGIYYTKKAIVDLFSGSLVPLILLPTWLRTASDLLPFSQIVYTPTMIWLGKINGAGLVLALGKQIGWAVLLYFLSESIYARAIRKVTINEG